MTTVIPRRIAWELEYEMKSDAEKLADAYAGVNLLMRAIEHRRWATSYAARPESYLMWDKIRDLQELVEAITRRMPKPPSVWRRLRNWVIKKRHVEPITRPSNAAWLYRWGVLTPQEFASGGYVEPTSKQPVADAFRAMNMPEPPPTIRDLNDAWLFPMHTLDAAQHSLRDISRDGYMSSVEKARARIRIYLRWPELDPWNREGGKNLKAQLDSIPLKRLAERECTRRR